MKLPTTPSRASHHAALAPSVGPAGAEEVEAELAYTRFLIDFLRPADPLHGDTVEHLLKLMEELIDGHAAVIAPDGGIKTGSQIPQTVTGDPDTLPVGRVRSGALGAIAAHHGGHYFQLLGIGKSVPRPVLVVARKKPFSSSVSNLISRTVTALMVSDRLAQTERSEQELAPARTGAMVAIHARLLSGDIEGARQLAEPLLPGVLNAARAEVYVVECTHNRRHEVLARCREAFKDVALAVPGGIEGQVVLVIPVPDVNTFPSVANRLRTFAVDNGAYAGGSRALPLDQMEDGHQMAHRALAVARRLPRHVAVHSGSAQLAHLLDRRAAGWAHEFLRPLLALPESRRTDITETLTSVLQHGHNGAARRRRLNRKTISVRWRQAEALLYLDLGLMHNRALLDLALQLAQRTPPQPSPAERFPLADLLSLPEAQLWAQELVGTLRRDTRPLMRTVRIWIDCNGNVAECAQLLGAHPNTVRNHLAACEELLGRRLIGSSAGANDIVNALRILGDPPLDPA